ncbi:MAG: hypothetical protein ACI965_002096 [Paraglaciecola sp.]|jgi:hypothetical protein
MLVDSTRSVYTVERVRREMLRSLFAKVRPHLDNRIEMPVILNFYSSFQLGIDFQY